MFNVIVRIYNSKYVLSNAMIWSI